MAKINGTDVLLYQDGVAIAHCTSLSINVNDNLRATSDKSDGGWETSAPGMRSWDATGDFYFNKSATEGHWQAFDRVNGRNFVNMRASDEVSGSFAWTGTAYIQGLTVNFPLEETGTHTITLKGTGPLAKTTIT